MVHLTCHKIAQSYNREGNGCAQIDEQKKVQCYSTKCFFKRKCVHGAGPLNPYHIIVTSIEIRTKKEYYIVSICMHATSKYNKQAFKYTH